MSERWLTIKEAAATRGIARWKLYSLISTGKGPPATHLGRAIRIRERALDDWMIAQEHTTPGEEQ